MDMGMMATALLAAAIAFVFILAVKRIVRKIAYGESDCCGGCAGCGGCQSAKEPKRADLK